MMQAAMNRAGTTPQEVSSETNSEMEMAEASQNIDATAQAQQIQQAQQPLQTKQEVQLVQLLAIL